MISSQQELRVDIKFGFSKKWIPSTVKLEQGADSLPHLLMMLNTAKEDCTSVRQVLYLHNLCGYKSTQSPGRLHCIELLRSKLKSVTIDCKEPVQKELWIKSIERLMQTLGGSANKATKNQEVKRMPSFPSFGSADVVLENGELLRRSIKLPLSKSKHNSMNSLGDSVEQTSSEDESDEDELYESIDKYIKPSSPASPPPVPKKILIPEAEKKLDKLYDTVNFLISAIKELELEQQKLQEERQSLGHRMEAPAAQEKIMLVDVSDTSAVLHYDSLPIPWSCPPEPPASLYLRPNSSSKSVSTANAEPIYAQIIKKKPPFNHGLLS